MHFFMKTSIGFKKYLTKLFNDFKFAKEDVSRTRTRNEKIKSNKNDAHHSLSLNASLIIVRHSALNFPIRTWSMLA